MLEPWIRRISEGGRRPVADRRRARPTVQRLEERLALATTTSDYFIPSVSATVEPSVLWPPNGRFVPVVVKGHVAEYEILDGKSRLVKPSETKEPPSGNFQVIDEYRRVQTFRNFALAPQENDYTFQFTVYLQASRVTEYAGGRHYYLVIAAQTRDGSGGTVLPVQVPISLKDRGQPPQPKPKKTIRPPHNSPTSGSLGNLFGNLFKPASKKK